MKRLLLVTASLALASIVVRAQTDTLRLSTMYTTHIIFHSELSYVDVSNKAIAAKVIESNKNILALKARMPFEYSTTISALENDGKMHTYIVKYEEHPDELVIDLRSGNGDENRKESRYSVTRSSKSSVPVMEDVMGKRQELYHIADRKYHIELVCEDVFVSNDVTYFVLSLKNRSGISYECADAGFIIESKKKSRRGLDYQKVLSTRSRHGTLCTQSKQDSKVVYSMDKVTLAKDQVLSIYVYETGGSRNFSLTLTSKDINDARIYR